MKKTYINPAMEIVKIQGRNVLSITSTVSIGVGDKASSVADGRYDDFDWEDEE